MEEMGRAPDQEGYQVYVRNIDGYPIGDALQQAHSRESLRSMRGVADARGKGIIKGVENGEEKQRV